MSPDEISQLASLGIVLLSALVAWFHPAWVFALVLIAVPLRVPIFPSVEIATLLFLGALLGRAREIVFAMRAEPTLLALTAALPAWFLVSALWALQPSFVFYATGKWLMVWLAMWLVVADDTLRPRRVVLSGFIAMAPSALWGAAERLRLIAPLGDPEILRNRAIDLGYMIRGRALFWHPNRLAEFVEQIGLLLIGCGMSRLMPVLCAVGVAIACFGVWGTDSKAGIATMVGGGLVTAALLWIVAVARRTMSATARRRASWIAAGGVVLALVVAAWAYVAHGGIGSRVLIYRYAWQLVEKQPILGVGGGNWALAVGMAPLSVSRFWFRSHAHSLPLQLLVEVGAIGVLLGVLFFATPLWVAWRRLGDAAREWRGVVHGAMAGVIGLLAHNLVHYFLRDPVDGITTGLLLGLAVRGVRSSGENGDVP
ncbi:MAG TPA: O-antigen ligase family protein [Candidatus Binatia bacterium]